MARLKAKKVGKGATLITLLSNPLVRRAVIRGATKAANSTAEFLAARREQSESTAAARPEASEPQVTVVPEPGSTTPPKPVKPASLSESAAVESIVGSVASVAKPMAERLASSSTGRSVLEAVNSISAQALGTSVTPKRARASVANFIGGILAGQTARKPAPAPGKPAVKFQPVKPPSAPASEPVKTMQWPPPKPPNGTGSP